MNPEQKISLEALRAGDSQALKALEMEVSQRLADYTKAYGGINDPHLIKAISGQAIADYYANYLDEFFFEKKGKNSNPVEVAGKIACDLWILRALQNENSKVWAEVGQEQTEIRKDFIKTYQHEKLDKPIEDVFSEAYEGFLKTVREDKIGYPYNWQGTLFRIAQRKKFDSFKKNQKKPTVDGDNHLLYVEDTNHSPTVRLFRQEIRELLYQCLEKCSPLCREYLTKRYFEDLSNQQIAELLESREDTIKNRGRDCLRQIRKCAFNNIDPTDLYLEE